MFTGIVEEVGQILEATPTRLVIQARATLEGARVGDSIAVNGACLTVVNIQDDTLAVDLTPETLALLMQYDWPGNVRELENAVEHAVIVAKDSVILPSDLPSNLTMSGMMKENSIFSAELSLRAKLNLLEKQIIQDALTRANGVKKQAAAMLQIDPRNFSYLLRKHNF